MSIATRRPVAELPGSSGRLKLDTASIPDGSHRLRIETVEGDRVTGHREIPFTVRNGPGIAVAGLSDRDEVRGQLGLAVDATAAGIDGQLDVHSLELHRGLPFWTGALAILIIILGALYLAVDPFAFRAYRAEELAIRDEAGVPLARIATDRPVAADPMQVRLTEGSFLPILDFDAGKADPGRGAATYGAKCAGCHGDDGQGRTAQSATLGEQGIFPRLAGQPAAYLYRQLWSFAHGWRSERRNAAHGGRPHRGGLGRHRRASRASDRRRLSGVAGRRQRCARLGPFRCRSGSAGSRRQPVQPLPRTWRHRVAPYFPALMGLDARYITAQIIAFRGGQRRNAMLRLMDPVAHGLEVQEIEAVAGYFARQRPGATQ